MKRDFMFSFRLNPKRSLIAVLVASTLTFLTVKCDISKEDILKIYNEIRKGIKFDLPDENNIINEIDRQLNERINRDPELLEYKVRTEVNDAIYQYEKLEKDTYVPNMKNEVILKEIESPKYSETQKQILKDAIYYEFSDGTMGIRGAWVTPDSREISLDNETK
tara:strand:+ start:318 stop:809 length:492 start_codon:yes stop_codon:yes gene_type:complete